MNNVTAALPRKSMNPFECKFLKIAGEELAKVKVGGPTALAYLLDIVASWHASRAQIPFHDYGQRWLIEGNAKNKTADTLLRDLFGLGDPAPRSAA
ncbi:hypothetical protein [Pseudomonas chlororaphis]|uniref:hypothetical protein n=1 Tax=Pseudomonas chlororaphis TaxID=587753 RepID=UPI001B30537A|nr:hypothetical protein [Pseudomonas chlororaphis]MBP5058491.1 hypothetical protein [Pseudomonas chlororaphis]MBP5140565.1 hypothetical protein [Pseudomonas chlororaphis]QTT99249.1 hypothetical protein HUT26_08185 [Pseudomonas chlororaphis]